MKEILRRTMMAILLLVMAPILIAASVCSSTTNFYEALVDIIRGKK